MGKVKVEIKQEGVKELMKSPEMLSICEEYAQNALQKLGDGYEATSMVGKNRCNASVSAVTPKAKKENSEKNTILKAVRSK